MSEKTSKYSKLINDVNKRESNRPNKLSEEQIRENKKAWTTFWRRNVNLYASQKLGIKLYPFQHVILYLASVSTVFFAICTRGLTKTFIVALLAMIECMLKPYTKVVITALTIPQGTTMVKEKMEDELCKKLSPVLRYLYDEKLIKFSYNQDNIRVDFVFNNSFILVLPMQDSSRGKRSCFTIYEECRTLKKGLIDSIFEGMAQPRQAQFLTNPKYSGDPDCIEDVKSVYITSARFKSEWFWKTFKQTVSDYYNDNENLNTVFAGDIFLAMEHGLKSRKQFLNYKKKMSELELRMEILNEMVGESEDAYFKLEAFKRNSVLEKAFIPPTIEDIINGSSFKNREKEEGEFRALFIDFAFKDSLINSENDNTVIGCMYGKLNEDKTILLRGVEYLETHSGSNTELAKKRIRELFFDYKADYIIPDFRNGGEMIFRDDLSKPYYHEERGVFWNGFTICYETDLLMTSDSDNDNFRKYVVDPDAIPCVIPIKGSERGNSDYHIAMRNSLREEKISFLIDELELEERNSKCKDYIMLEEDMKVRIRLPHIQTSLLINEAINLSAEYKDGKVVLKEPRNGTKDRYMACSYSNYIFNLIENKVARGNQVQDVDVSAWAGALCM